MIMIMEHYYLPSNSFLHNESLSVQLTSQINGICCKQFEMFKQNVLRGKSFNRVKFLSPF
jgi:hypothetical protein